MRGSDGGREGRREGVGGGYDPRRGERGREEVKGWGVGS